MKAKDLSGQRFGRLVVLERSGTTKHRNTIWLCQCDCGNTKEVQKPNLTSGDIKSCGCLKSEKTSERNFKHGLSHHYLYVTWTAAKKRTTNPKYEEFEYYGGRGIKMADEWLNDPKAFIDWILKNLGERPEGCSLDRINTDGNYEPSNLRWATASEQRINQRRREVMT